MAKNSFNAVIGLRQILREAKNGNVSCIILAKDVDSDYCQSVKNIASDYNVTLRTDGTKDSLAETYGIEVATGAVGILKDLPQ